MISYIVIDLQIMLMRNFLSIIKNIFLISILILIFHFENLLYSLIFFIEIFIIFNYFIIYFLF